MVLSGVVTRSGAALAALQSPRPPTTDDEVVARLNMPTGVVKGSKRCSRVTTAELTIAWMGSKEIDLDCQRTVQTSKMEGPATVRTPLVSWSSLWFQCAKTRRVT